MGMNEEIRFIHLDNIDELRINTLEQQIKSYKDREDKLRKILGHCDSGQICDCITDWSKSLLQILNEGSDGECL